MRGIWKINKNYIHKGTQKEKQTAADLLALMRLFVMYYYEGI